MTQASINNLNEQVQQYSLLIANKQAELEASQAEEQRLNEQYKTRIRSMEETGNISYWAILFGANSFSDLLDKIDVIQEIAKADQLMLEKMKAVSENRTSERTELEQQMAELDVTREELDQQELELEDQRAEADTCFGDMMKAYEEMNADYEQNMADEAELSDEIAKSEAAYYAALSKEEAERIAALNRQNNNKGSNSNSSGATNTGGWLYPLPYQCQVTDSYGYRTHPLTGKYSWHNGVDFGAAAGTAILATKSGTVTTAAYSAAWGYYVVINHGDGYSTLYAARVLASQAQLLLMDEPFASLDFLTRGELQSQLLAIQKKLPRTIVLVTHQLEEALLLGQKIVVMHPDSTIREFDLSALPYPRDVEQPALRALKAEITDECRKPTASE